MQSNEQKAKHTPGPWSVRKSLNYGSVTDPSDACPPFKTFSNSIHGFDNRNIADVRAFFKHEDNEFTEGFGYAKSVEEHEANVALIAACPLMFEALTKIAADTKGLLPHIHEMAEAAIAKATVNASEGVTND